MLTLWGTTTTRTLRPIWIAEELGLEYDLRPLQPRTGETQTHDFTALNPKQKIPALTDGEFTLTESLAISRYLITRYDHDHVFYSPDSPESAATEDAWCCHIYGEIDETGLYVMRRHGDLASIYGEAPAALSACVAYVSKHLKVISDHLQQREYIMAHFGLADVLLMSCLTWAEDYGVSLSDCLASYRSRIKKRPAYRAAVKANYGLR